MSSKKLTQDEVDALISSVDTSAKAKADVSDSKGIRDFVFGSDDLSLLGDYYALRVINERFARLARTVFQPMLRVQPRITALMPEVKTFDQYCENAPVLMSLTTSRIDELRGSKMMVIQPGFISALTNAYYGGDLGLRYQPRAEFTATETRVIEIITEGLNRTLLAAWQDLMQLTFSDESREENLQFASFVEGGETVIICSFLVQLPKADDARIDILYPLQTLKPIAAQLRSRMQSEVIDDDMTWRERLERAVSEVRLPINVQLSKPRVSLRQLISITKGDVYPIQLREGLSVMVQGQKMFFADIGEVAGTSAITITQKLDQARRNKMKEQKMENQDKDPKGPETDKLRALENIEVEMSVEVGRTEISISELLRLNEGSVVELDRLAGEPLDILVNGTLIAKGEIVMVGERFGIRFSDIVDPENRVGSI